MTARASDNSSATTRLIERAVGGEQAPLGELLERHRGRLRRMVAIRMDARLQGRLDPSDVIQEAFLEAGVRLHEYGRDPTMPFFLWLRLITGQQLMILHRRHLKTQARAAGREVNLRRGALPEASGAALAAQLLGHETRASEAVDRAERKIHLQTALDAMDPLDREILTLRHFERLSLVEAAQELGISQSAAGQRHFRAVKRLKEILAGLPGGLRDFMP
jgi:RNA polymerase sigma-70 factor (ECF subfamily)